MKLRSPIVGAIGFLLGSTLLVWAAVPINKIGSGLTLNTGGTLSNNLTTGVAGGQTAIGTSDFGSLTLKQASAADESWALSSTAQTYTTASTTDALINLWAVPSHNAVASLYAHPASYGSTTGPHRNLGVMFWNEVLGGAGGGGMHIGADNVEGVRLYAGGHVANDQGLQVAGSGAPASGSGVDVVLSVSAIPTNATAGFLWLAGMAGTPTGIPGGTYTGRNPIQLDVTNGLLYWNTGSTWQDLYARTSSTSDAVTNTTTNVFNVRHLTSGTAAAGYGTGITIQGEDDAGNAETIGVIRSVLSTVTAGAETGAIRFAVVSSGSLQAEGSELYQLRGDGSFYMPNGRILFGGITGAGVIEQTNGHPLYIKNVTSAPIDFELNGSTFLSLSSSDGAMKPSCNVAMQNDRFVLLDVNAGLTASTTQTQGQGALTAQMNEVANVANADDVVTMPAATAGSCVKVINNGTNQLQIFPASGDQFSGSAVDASITLASGANTERCAYNDTVWEAF